MPVSNKVVGMNIARLRQGRGLTQQQLAAILSVSHQAVSKWETGAAMPDVDSLMNMSRLFGVTMEELLSESKPDPFSSLFDKNVIDGFRETMRRSAGAARDIGKSFSNAVRDTVEACRDLGKNIQYNRGEDDETEEAYTETGHESMNGMTLEALTDLAPFMSKEKLSAMVMAYCGDVNPATLISLAPFLSEDALDFLFNRLAVDGMDMPTLIGFAPFMKKERLFKLVLKNADKLDMASLRQLAPFLKKGMVDVLFDAVSGVKQAAASEKVTEFTEKARKGAQDIISRVGDAIDSLSRKDESESEEEPTYEAEYGSESREPEERPDEPDAAEPADAPKETPAFEPSLKDKVARAALEARSWNWLKAHVCEITDPMLIMDIAVTAAAELDDDDARDIIMNSVPYMESFAVYSACEKLCAAGKWELLCDLASMTDTATADMVLTKACAAGDTAVFAAKAYARRASKNVITECVRIAIDNNDTKIILALTE